MFMFLMRACILDFYYTNIGLCIAARIVECGVWKGKGRRSVGGEHSVSNGKCIMRRAAWHRPRFAAPPNMKVWLRHCVQQSSFVSRISTIHIFANSK